MSFSNKETQIGGARGPKPGHDRPPGIVIGKKRKKLLLHAAVMIEAINIGEPEFEGDSLSYSQSLVVIAGVENGRAYPCRKRRSASHVSCSACLVTRAFATR